MRVKQSSMLGYESIGGKFRVNIRQMEPTAEDAAHHAVAAGERRGIILVFKPRCPLKHGVGF